MTRDAREHSWTDLFGVMEREYVIRKASPRQRLCELRSRLICHPIRSKAASTRRAFAAGHVLIQAARLRRAKGDTHEVRSGFLMLKPVRQHAERRRFSSRDRLIPRFTVGENS